MAQTRNQKSATKKKTARRSTGATKAAVVHYIFLRVRWAHHRHSFKLLHHRHTSYSLLTFMVLLAAVLSLSWTTMVKGDVYTVHAVIQAEPVTVPAIITSPPDGFETTNQMTTIKGTCPADSYVKVRRNGAFSGVALCQANGSWQLAISLFPGDNLLQAQVYNLTDSPGPASPGVVVTYRPPAVPSVTATIEDSRGGNGAGSNDGYTSKTGSTATPIILSSEYSFVGYYVNQLSNWPLTIGGGTAPYAVQFDWGDGTTDLKSVAQAGSFDLQHAYNAPGGYHNSYIIKIMVTDAAGQTTLLQLLTIISLPAGDTVASVGTAGSGHIGSDGTATAETSRSPLQQFWRVAGPTYAVTLVGLGSFWLGQHRELELLRQKAVQHHRRRPV